MVKKLDTSHVVDVPPNATRTLMAMREMGYDSYAAICDLIDNSIDAKATKISVTVRPLGKSVSIDVLDNGIGMGEERLKEALRLGSDVEHKATDLGKFGMGLVTASLSLAQSIEVITREHGKPAYEAVLDLDTVERHGKFVITLKPASGRRVFDTVDKGGTLVRLTKIDRIHDTNVSRFAGRLRDKVGQTFRHYISQGINIMVNGRNARLNDPLMLAHAQTEVRLDTSFDLGDGTKATLKVVELPDLGTEGDAQAGIFPHNSGFYVVRNGREIIAGETFGFYRHHHSYSHFRAELAYTGKSTAFHEDVKKSSVHPDDRLRDRLRKATEKLIAESGRERRATSPAPVRITHTSSAAILAKLFSHDAAPTSDKGTLPVQFCEEKPPKKNDPHLFYVRHKDGTMTICYNEDHPLVQFVSEAKNAKASAILDLMTYAMAKSGENARTGPRFALDFGSTLRELVGPAVQ
jgi:hypothetical protein